MAELSSDDLLPHETDAVAKLKEIAREELGETEELKAECLQELKMLIREHKVACPSTDDFLLRFLRTKKFKTKKSFEALQNYSYQRRVLHKLLLKFPTEALETCLRLNIIGFLPHRDAEEQRIYFFRPGIWNPSICSLKDLLTILFIHVIHAAEDVTAQISGMVCICDLKSFPATQFLYIMPYINRWRNFMFNCVPARYTAVHVISNSILLKYVCSVIFPFVPKKIVERVLFHREGEDTLFEHIPPNILPDVFGGTQGPVDSNHRTQAMMDHLRKVKDDYHYFQQDS